MDEDRPYLPELDFRRSLRNSPTPAEKVLWGLLQKEKTGFKFTRQLDIGSYTVDFCCRSHRVVVELDGDSHLRRIEEDEARDISLSQAGYQVMRFKNEDVFEHPRGVAEKIKAACEGRRRWRY